MQTRNTEFWLGSDNQEEKEEEENIKMDLIETNCADVDYTEFVHDRA
jgi:hypothetical protein